MERTRSAFPKTICEMTDLSLVEKSVLSCKLFDFEGHFYAETTAFFNFWLEVLPHQQDGMTDYYRKKIRMSNDYQSVSYKVVYDRNKCSVNGKARKRTKYILSESKCNHVCVYDLLIFNLCLCVYFVL
jgi:hypothetical protein